MTRHARHRRLLLAAIALASLHCASPNDAPVDVEVEATPELVQVSDGRFLMGTILDITLIGEDEAALREAMGWAFHRVAELEQVASTYLPDSDVSRLNRAAGQGPSLDYAPELRQLLELSLQATERTRGAFDVTVGPLIALWSRASDVGRWPKASAVASAWARVGPQAIVLAPDGGVGLAWPGCAVDFGGIAKGHALDEVHAGLVARGITRGLLDFGGSSVWAMGRALGGGPWRFEVDTRAPEEPPRILALDDTALSVSSSLGESSRIGERIVGHVIDPRSGQTIDAARTALAIGDSAARAETWSTALLVLDPEEGPALAGGDEAIEAWVRYESGSHGATPGFAPYWSTEPAAAEDGPLLW